MKKISFLPLVICISIAFVLVAALEAGWFTGPRLANSDLDSDKLAEKHFRKAIGLLKQENYQEAIEEYNKVIKLLPDSLIAQNAQYWIGQAYFRMGELDKALSIFGKLIKDYPRSAIIPVTQLMIARVEKDKEIKKTRAKRDVALDKKVISDPKTGAKYKRIAVLTGKKDVVEFARGNLFLSPNGKFLLYGELVIPLEGGEPFELVDEPTGGGIWSPDGKKVAIYLEDAICMIPVSPETGRPAGPPKKLLDYELKYRAVVSWAPDSERIVFERGDTENNSDIWALSVNDGVLTQITDDPIWEGRPVWSSDGKTIAYNWGNRELRIASAEGGKFRKIADYGRPYSFSPDGKWLFFYKGIKPRLYRMDDGRVFKISPAEGVGSFFAWSPEGKKMLFYSSSYNYICNLKVVSTSSGPSFQLGRELKLWPYVHYWTPDGKMLITHGGELYDQKLWIIPLAGGEARSLELDVPGVSKPHPRSLSLDCKKLLLFESQGEDKEDLYVVPVSLKETRTTGAPVMVFRGRDKKPVGYGRRDEWTLSPDGKKLAVVHGGNIWITSADKGKPVQITNKPEPETYPVWSPDSKMIAYMEKLRINEEGEGEESLHVISASGGKSKKILNISGKEMYAWSPDSKKLAVISEGKISVIPISGGKAREVLDLKREGFMARVWGLCWIPDGNNFAFIGEKGEEGIRTRIYLVSAKGGKVIELAADDDGFKYWIYPSPDGKWISYASDGFVKIRSQATIWEVNVEDLLGVEEKEQK